MHRRARRLAGVHQGLKGLVRTVAERSSSHSVTGTDWKPAHAHLACTRSFRNSKRLLFAFFRLFFHDNCVHSSHGSSCCADSTLPRSAECRDTSSTQIMKLRTILLLPLRLGRLRKSSRRRYIVPLGDAPPQSNVAPLTSAQATAHAEAAHMSRLAIGIAATRAKRLAMSADAAEPCRYTDEDAFFDELDRDQRLRVVGRHLDHVSKP